MGVLSFLIAKALGAKPFQSELLDKLAETMRATEILKRGKLKRYYKVRSLQAGCLSYLDVIFFDAKYYEMLSPEEFLAVGAHEFNHIIERHGIKKLKRIVFPVLAIAFLMGFFVFVAYQFINPLIIFDQSESILMILLFAALSLLPFLILSFYFNAKWLRMLESQSDLRAVEFVNGKAMISALTKLKKLKSMKPGRLGSRLFPKTYPTFEQRIADIRAAMETKRNQDFP